MPSRKHLLLYAFAVALAAILIVLFAPFWASAGVRSWLWWKTRGTNVTIKIDSIEAPFLHPIVLRGIRVQTPPNSKAGIDATAHQLRFGLNMKAILLRMRGRTVRNLEIDGARVELRRNEAGTPLSENAWNTLHRLLPESFTLKSLDLRVEAGTSLYLLRGVTINGTPIEAGRFEAAEVLVSSPKFRQTFTGLRGATDWQGERLTIAGLALTRGVDLQSVLIDLSHIGKRRIAVDFDVDTFGGKLRGSVADEWRSRRSNWNIAGSANDISVSQTAEAFGFTEHIGGLVHAGKFTFRGDLAEALSGTASLWMELTGPAWRDREADVIMVGLSLYGRQLELQQLYIKQRKNELTLNGQSSFPTTPAGWLRPDFRGTVSAAIDDLGEFASLLGANRNDFAGRMEIEGTLNARDRNVGGNLVADGFGLTMFKRSIDEFHAELKLKKDETEITHLEFKRGNDRIWAQGRIDNSAEHNYSGSIDATLGNVADYLPIFGEPVQAPPTEATFHSDITSSIWEARAVLDPPRSKPVEVVATFPLPIGQPFEQLFNSSINLTINIPELHVEELPRRAGPHYLQSGIVTAQVSITENLRHPRITGYSQLIGGHTNSTAVDTRLRFDGTIGTVEFLTIASSAAAASFFGDLDFQDTEHLTAWLFPNQPIYNLTSPVFDCLSQIELVPFPVTEPSMPGVGKIELQGGLRQREWNVSLTDVEAAGLPDSAVPNFVSRTLRFCPKTGPSTAALQIGVLEPPAPSPTPKPAKPRKRKR